MSNYYNVKQSINDYRDIIFDKLVSSELSLLPQCNYISDLLPIRDQGLQGTCFAQSAACMKEWQEKRDIGLNEYLSPQFFYNQRNYWNNNIADGNDANEDYGMTGRDVMRILLHIGICKESEYPYGKQELAKDIAPDIYESTSPYHDYKLVLLLSMGR